jgi:hypothetical protein
MIIMDFSIIKPQILIDQAPLPHYLIPSSGHQKPPIRRNQDVLHAFIMNFTKVMSDDSFLNIPLFQLTVFASSKLKDPIMGQSHTLDTILMGLFIFLMQFISLYNPLLEILIITTSE